MYVSPSPEHLRRLPVRALTGPSSEVCGRVTVPSAADVFFESLAAALSAQAATLAARWTERAAAAAPRPAVVEGADAGAAVDAESVVRALVLSLRKDARWPGEVMRLGWEAGIAGHHAGLAPHHVLTDAELLVAVVLAAAEQAVRRAAEGAPDDTGPIDPMRTAGAADGIAAARQLQRAGGLYTHAAAASFLHAIVSALRAHYRILRHDLRNPVGTIRGALSLMEDESVPIESRLGPKVRAMVARNALSLDDLISTGLDDVTAESLLKAPQQLSLRDLALATRRALREPARLADCDIVVADALPAGRVDAAAVELTLSAVLLAGIACAAPGDVLRVEDGRPPAPEGADPARPLDAITLRVVHERAEGVEGGQFWELVGLELAASVAADFGGCVGATPSEDPGHVPERRRVRRIGRRTDPAPVPRATPSRGPAAVPPVPPVAGRERSPIVPVAASARHQGNDLARPD